MEINRPTSSTSPKVNQRHQHVTEERLAALFQKRHRPPRECDLFWLWAVISRLVEPIDGIAVLSTLFCLLG